jgi:hypothetical protein
LRPDDPIGTKTMRALKGLDPRFCQRAKAAVDGQVLTPSIEKVLNAPHVLTVRAACYKWP